MDQTPSSRQAEGFSARLIPHRSLGPRGFLVLMIAVSAISFIAGVVFWIAGAWPVFFFFGVDVALVYFAFKLNYASAKLYETVEIAGDELIVRRVQPGRKPKKWTFHPYWVRVEMEHSEENYGPLYLRSHGKSLQIGAFLSGEERHEFAEALRSALSEA